MNTLQKGKRDDLLRFIKWMMEYPEMADMISTDNNANVDQCIEVIEELERQEFYILIPLFLSHNINTNVDKGISRFVAKKILESLVDMSIEDISAEFKEILLSA